MTLSEAIQIQNTHVLVPYTCFCCPHNSCWKRILLETCSSWHYTPSFDASSMLIPYCLCATINVQTHLPTFVQIKLSGLMSLWTMPALSNSIKPAVAAQQTTMSSEHKKVSPCLRERQMPPNAGSSVHLETSSWLKLSHGITVGFILRICIYQYDPVGGWPTPLKNMTVNGKDDIPYIMENQKCSKPPTSY